MKTQHRQASQHKRQMMALHGNPVFKAISRKVKSDARQEFESQLLDTRIKLLSATDGHDATELLAMLSVVIGTPCEAGARQYSGHAYPWIGQLHGALRTLQGMCLTGYCWQSQYALALDRALEIAGEDRPELDDHIFAESFIDANTLATQILRHEVTPQSVAAKLI
jgi:hypothetical protein